MRERFQDAISRRLAQAVVTERVALMLDRPAVSFTFDDIPETAATVGARILEDRGVRGTFYVCGDIAGGDWDRYRLASLDQVGRLGEAGHEIGCHTAHHLSAYRVGAQNYRADIERNATALAPVTTNLKSFAYPYGAVTLRHKSSAQPRFGVCRGIHGGMAVDSYDRGLLEATALEEGAIDERGIEMLIELAVLRNAWLTFYSHDVADDPSPFGVSPKLLTHAVDVALARGCRVETVRDVLARNDAARAARRAARA